MLRALYLQAIVIVTWSAHDVTHHVSGFVLYSGRSRTSQPARSQPWRTSRRRHLVLKSKDCRRTHRELFRQYMASTEVDVGVNVNLEYRPDRDTESQAYQSAEGQTWKLKYHDIKTRRDTSDTRAKVSPDMKRAPIRDVADNNNGPISKYISADTMFHVRTVPNIHASEGMKMVN